MAYTLLTAAEAASLIKNGENLALSGFTPAGVAKAVTKELAKVALAEHEAGREFKVGIFTGASTGQSTDGDLANANAIKYRAPYTTNNDFRKHVNAGEIPYNDLHLSHMAQELRYGFYGDVDWAILEVCDIEEADTYYKAYLTAAGGISPTAARLAKRVILELNSFHNANAKFIHDVYEPLDPPCRQPIPIFRVGDRIGKPYVEIPKEKLVGVVECNIPDEARAFKDSDPVTDRIGYLTAEFLVEELHAGRMPKEFLPLQSGVGSTANAILGALGADKHVPDFNIYTEVIQNSVIDMMLTGRVKDASACSLTVSNECLMQVYDNMDYFKDHLTLRQSEISNHPAVIRRLGVIAINTAIECDIYGNANSTHISGVRMMNGIGGSGDFERNAYLRAASFPSSATRTTQSTTSTSSSRSKVWPTCAERAPCSVHNSSLRNALTRTTSNCCKTTSNLVWVATHATICPLLSPCTTPCAERATCASPTTQSISRTKRIVPRAPRISRASRISRISRISRFSRATRAPKKLSPAAVTAGESF